MLKGIKPIMVVVAVSYVLGFGLGHFITYGLLGTFMLWPAFLFLLVLLVVVLRKFYKRLYK